MIDAEQTNKRKPERKFQQVAVEIEQPKKKKKLSLFERFASSAKKNNK